MFVSFSDRMCAFCVLSLYFLFIYLFSVSQIFIYLPWLALVFILLLLVFIFAKKEIILEGLVSVLEKTKRKSMSSEVITLDVTLCFGCNRVFEFTSVI